VTISVVIPVLNGERYLGEVLAAVARQRVDEDVEVVVIDSGSSDRSVAIARAAGAEVVEIPESEFQHGRTRNLGVARTKGRLVAFLTQDATPAHERWLAAYAEVFASDPLIGAAYGPHLPRPDANPLMARLLTEFFREMSPNGETVVHERGSIDFLSNSNSCISRALWQELPFPEIPYAEDRALGAALLEAGWKKAFVPGAAAIHSHNYSLAESSRRWFDEYRGLREAVGEKHEASASGVVGIVLRSVRADNRWLREDPRYSGTATLLWTMRSVVYHCCRVLFGGLGARADRLPAWLRERLSLEGRSDGIDQPVTVSRAGPTRGRGL
jgi:rhamnosyltransferase